MIATEPLGPETWAEIGLDHREAFEDGRHLIFYGQRTADDRIAFGGLSVPYRYGSHVDHAPFAQSPVHERLRRTLVDLFPVLAGLRVTHRWGGVLAIPRDWFPSVGLDRHSGLAWAGGYVGEGVAAANLAGRTLADLITARVQRPGSPAVGRPSVTRLGERAGTLAGADRRSLGARARRSNRVAHRTAAAVGRRDPAPFDGLTDARRPPLRSVRRTVGRRPRRCGGGRGCGIRWRVAIRPSRRVGARRVVGARMLDHADGHRRGGAAPRDRSDGAQCRQSRRGHACGDGGDAARVEWGSVVARTRGGRWSRTAGTRTSNTRSGEKSPTIAGAERTSRPRSRRSDRCGPAPPMA